MAHTENVSRIYRWKDLKSVQYRKCISKNMQKSATKYRNYANQTTKCGRRAKKRTNKGKNGIDLGKK